MPGRWNDEFYGGDDWRAEGYGGREHARQTRRGRYDEGRSFGDDQGRWESEGHDRVFGERDTGVGYNLPETPRYGRAEGYAHGYGRGRPDWQDRDYQGVSPAMRHGGYELEREARYRRPRFQNQDYTRGGRFYGDDGRGRIYREEYGQGGFEYGRSPRGWDEGGGRRSYARDYERETRRPLSGGTGGYDYEERGYGDGGRDRDAGRDAGDFLSRAGERISNWFGNAAREVRRDLFEDHDHGHRGRGPKGYTRPDDRISDDAHRALTDDPWVDASQISVSVSGGEVTLSGTVENREAKHRAERAVEDLPGVTHVQNNLRVDRGSFFTSPTRGFGDSAVDAQMRGEGGANGGTSVTPDSASTRTTTRRT